MSADKNTRGCPAIQPHPFDTAKYRRCKWAEHLDSPHEWLNEWLEIPAGGRSKIVSPRSRPCAVAAAPPAGSTPAIKIREIILDAAAGDSE